jgi:hypothetical protein
MTNRMRLFAVCASLGLVLLGLAATPARAASVTVAAAGDIALADSPGTAQTQTANLIGAFDPTAVFPLGDEQYEDGALSDFRSSYDPTWGQYLDRSYPVVGNHEYQTPGANGYYTYFGVQTDQLRSRKNLAEGRSRCRYPHLRRAALAPDGNQVSDDDRLGQARRPRPRRA